MGSTLKSHPPNRGPQLLVANLRLTMQVDHLFSYTIIGDPGVGKSCLEQQFTARTFPEAHERTVGFEFGTRTIDVDGRRIKLYIWETEGRETFRSATEQCYYRAASIILVYDITRRETFDHIAIWLSRAGVTLVLIGNKCDLSRMRAVSYEEGRKFAKRHNLVFMEASAKTTQNVDECIGFTPSESGGAAGSSYGRSNCCLVWCQKLACQYVGKPKNWLSFGWQPAYLANLSKPAIFGKLWSCQMLECQYAG